MHCCSPGSAGTTSASTVGAAAFSARPALVSPPPVLSDEAAGCSTAGTAAAPSDTVSTFAALLPHWAGGATLHHLCHWPPPALSASLQGRQCYRCILRHCLQSCSTAAAPPALPHHLPALPTPLQPVGAQPLSALLAPPPQPFQPDQHWCGLHQHSVSIVAAQMLPSQHRQEEPACLRHCCRAAITSATPACTTGVVTSFPA